MNDAVKKFFKRNPNAKVVHQVLSELFTKLDRATLYKKSIRAKKVVTWTRAEYDKKVASPPVADRNDDIQTS
jgi:hypothetical protein